MGMKCPEEPFNMGMFFDLRHPSQWEYFQTPYTRIQVFHTGISDIYIYIYIYICIYINTFISSLIIIDI